MSIGDDIVRVLVSHDPRRSADSTLGLLIGHLGADGAGCFRIQGERVVLFTNRGMDQLALDRVASTWDDARASLLAGHVFDADALFSIIPIGSPGAVAGLLYIGGSHGFFHDHETIERLLPLLRAALETPQGGPPPIDAYIERTSPAQFQREQLFLLLERYGWNIAQVARVKGVARLTIYDQMKRWSIERRKIAKSRRPSTAP